MDTDRNQYASSDERGRIERIGVVGFGYVGRALAAALDEAAEVVFHDPAITGSVSLGDLVAAADAVFVCVPTPPGVGGAADISIVEQVVQDLVPTLADRGRLVVIKSTVPPGTCDRLSWRWPEIALVANPEFLRERHHLEDGRNPARIVLGWTEGVSDPGRAALRELYGRRFPEAPLVEMSALEAELVKYASNAFFGVKVSFANEQAALCERLGVSWERVRQALVLDPRIADDHLRVPGLDGRPGFGGACLPKDMAALRAIAEELGLRLALVETAIEENRRRRSGGGQT